MRFGIRDVTNVTLKALSDTKIGKQTFKKGQPVIVLDTAKTGTLEGSATDVFAQGGRGNPKLVGWSGDKNLVFTLEEALLSPTSFAVLAGAANGSDFHTADKTNAVKVPVKFETTIGEGGIATIDADTAGEDTSIFVDTDFPVYGMVLDQAGSVIASCENSKIEGPIAADGVYTIVEDTPLKLTFTGAEKYVGASILVDCYAVKKSGATVIEIAADTFGGYYALDAETLFREEATGVDMPAVFQLPKVKLQSNFSLAMASSGDPSTVTFTFDCFPGTVPGNKSHKVLGALTIVGEENVKPV